MAKKRQELAAQQQKAKFPVPEVFYEHLDDILARTTKDKQGVYPINLGEAYKSFQDKGLRLDFTIPDKRDLDFVDAIVADYEAVGRIVTYRYAKSLHRTLYDFYLAFSE